MYKNIINIITILFFMGGLMNAKSLIVKTKSFKADQKIPSRYGYKNQNISPDVSWSTGPLSTKSYVVLCNDPDAPTAQPWLHWLVFNIPDSITTLAEDQKKIAILHDGIQQALNDYGKVGWGGPNPPSGTHRYYFHVYALDIILNLDQAKKIDQAKFMAQIKDHIVAQGFIMGTYDA